MGSEFYRPGKESFVTHWGRIVFCGAVARVEPDVLRTLEDDVFPVFEQHPPFTHDELVSADGVGARNAWRHALATDSSPLLGELLAALGQWQSRWHLLNGWIAEEAVLAMWRWCSWGSGEVTEGLTFTDCWAPSSLDADVEPFPLPYFEIALPPWDIQTRTRAQAETFMTAEFEKALQNYLDAVERYAQATGMERSPELRARKGGSVYHDFEWLARYQLGKEKQLEIATAEKLSAQSVSDAIRSTAALIGLSLREGRAAPRRFKGRRRRAK